MKTLRIYFVLLALAAGQLHAQNTSRVIRGVVTDAANLAPSFKLDHLASIMPECEAARWNNLHQEIEKELGLKRHRASNDALMLQRTWVRLMDSNQFAVA